MAGEPLAVQEAALRGVAKAAELIDLTRHAGAHPRIGAVDVLPFVPVSGVSMAECVELAHGTGRAIWERYRIPVYFYEAAATQSGARTSKTFAEGSTNCLRDQASRRSLARSRCRGAEPASHRGGRVRGREEATDRL